MTPRHRKKPPLLWLMTDERIETAALLAAADRLPRGKAGIVFRHYRTPAGKRRALFARLAAIARRRRLLLLLGGGAREAVAWKADGWHGRGERGRSAGRPMIHSAPAHDAKEIKAARRGGADLVFLSPLFHTRSHPGARTLGRVRFAALAREAAMPVIALGGVGRHHRRGLKALGASGWAAIDGLSR
ncbi:MAG: thiamine phosphate synthase [Sphingobium sp.]|nr:thiamine phosphate synthase [Sphingobium sp.]